MFYYHIAIIIITMFITNYY